MYVSLKSRNKIMKKMMFFILRKRLRITKKDILIGNGYIREKMKYLH
jgi:hypothetical protein